MRHCAAAVLLLVSLTPAAASASDPRAVEALMRAKSAMGGEAWDNVRFLRTQVKIEISGLKGTGESFEDLRTGAYVDRYDLGVYKDASGYDGTTIWHQDPSGQVAVQGSEDARQHAANESYRRARAYWFADRAPPADIALAPDMTEGGRTFHVVRITPKDGRPFDFWIDAKTHLIERMAERNARELVTVFYSDYRPVDGKLVPFVARQSNGQVKYDASTKADSVTFEAEGARTAFAPPPPPKRDFGFSGSAHTTTIPFKLVNNHIYMEVRVNGRPLEMLFDTGGLNVITPTVVAALGLRAEGAIEGSGAGEASTDVGFTKVDRMEVGSAWLENQTFAVIGLENFDAVDGVPNTSIVGYEIFKRFVVGIDYENLRVTLTEPEGFGYRGAGVRVPMTLNGRTPEVMGEIDGIPGRFWLDTGSRSTLDLLAPFVAKHDLIKRYNARYQGVTGWGVGGPARAWVVRGKRFTMGGVIVDDLIVELSQATKGSFSDTYVAGNVGAGFLKQFNIVWDYPRHQIFFEKNANHGTRDVFDRAGFWANVGEGAFDVVDVIADTPADRAGLKTGDHIVSVNGKKAGAEVSLPDFRLLKKGPIGTDLILEVMRGTQHLRIKMTLRDIV